MCRPALRLAGALTRARLMVFLADDAADRTARLIEAHEAERLRLARELHDDVGQRLAVLTMDLDAIRSLPLLPPEVGARLQEVSDRTLQLARDIQALSQRLHPPKLDYLGLESAAASFCREMSRRHEVDIAFSAEGIPNDVPAPVALSVFRVMQQAVTNAVQHAGVRHVDVTLAATADELRLDVEDTGIGFDFDEVFSRGAPGLVGMLERIRLLKGQLDVQARRGAGTSIRARVPLSSSKRSPSAT
jgi:signal transduction histidine kinase